MFVRMGEEKAEMFAFRAKPRQTKDAGRTTSKPAPDSQAHGPVKPESTILGLQLALGNQAVQHSPRATPGHGEPSPAFGKGEATPPASLPFQHPEIIQPKLMIHAPGDVYEQQADKISEEVMRVPEPRSTAPTPGLRQDGALQTKTAVAATTGQTTAPPIVHEVLGSAGQPLDAAARAFMEARFGENFSQVRVHADEKAGRSATSIAARAYSVGNDLVFAKGQYAPRTREGQALLAHELTHVTQQQAMPGQAIQRSPDDAGMPDTQTVQPPAPAPMPVPASPPASVAIDPDANEASARATSPDLPEIDRAKQKPEENDQAAQALVWVAFPDADALNAAFDKLSPEVKSQVDHYASVDIRSAKKAGQKPDEDQVKTANRAQFLGRMRLYFNSWADVLSHFSAIERVDKKFKNVEMFLHHDAKVRFERAATVLLGKGHELPRIGEGFSVRGYHRGEIQHPGFMIHAMGYAFDVSARENPKIAFARPGAGVEKHDPSQIAVTVGAARGHMDMGPSNEGFIESMGKRTAADLTLSATDDKDPDTVKYFQHFEEQFLQMQAGSVGFTQHISQANREKLLKIRDAYFDVLKQMAAERKKGPKADAKMLGALEGARRALLASIPGLVTEWITAIDAEITNVFTNHPGMDKLRSPSDITSDLKKKEAEVKQATKDEALAQGAKAKAMAERDAASEARSRAEAWKHRARSGVEFQRAWQAADQARQKLLEKMDAALEAINNELDTRRALGDVTSARDTLRSELKASDTPKLKGPWAWIGSLRELRQALKSPDLSTAAGVRVFERLTTGDLSELGPNAAVDNPPLLRLLQVGFFNPKGAFDLAFFEEMAHSGFWPGATWNFGGADPMHFELVEGRHSILSPGKKTP